MTSQGLSAQQLENIVAPVALYPDDLLAILLPSATTPLEIVKAQRFLDRRKSDPNLQPDASMPAPVKSLLNYPDVVKRMSDDLDWTSALGAAVTVQQKDVVDAIQAFRRKVYAVGNLKSDDKQIVVVEKETIKVVQANPQVIYVPQYQPAQVVVVSSDACVCVLPDAVPRVLLPIPARGGVRHGGLRGRHDGLCVQLEQRYDQLQLQRQQSPAGADQLRQQRADATARPERPEPDAAARPGRPKPDAAAGRSFRDDQR